MAKIKGKLADDVKAFCKECFGTKGKEAVCKKLQHGKPCPLYEWWMKPRGIIEAAIKENCRFCLNGHKKDSYCVSPDCVFFQYNREEAA